MQYWLAEHADTIFYSLFFGLAAMEILLRWILKVNKTNVILEYVDSGFVAIILALVIRTLLIQTFFIPSGSMENTLLIQDKLIVNKFIYGTRVPFTDRYVLKLRDPRRGDVLVFRYPKNPKIKYIKRCLGVPGDVIAMQDKVLYVNGEPLAEPYASWRDSRIFPPPHPRDNFGPLTIPPGHYLMLGDNRDESADSRFWGLLRRELIDGRAWVIYWPISRWRAVK